MSTVPADGRGQGRGRARAGRAALSCLAALMMVLGVVLAARADVLAAPPLLPVVLAEEDPDLLVSSDWGIADLSDLQPGSPAYWFVDAAVVGVEGASLTLRIRKDGELMEVPNGVTVVVERCTDPWVDGPGGPSCRAGRTVVARAVPDDDLSSPSPAFPLDAVDAREPSSVMVTLSIADTPENRADESLMGLTGSLGLGITAVEAVPGETDPPTDPPTESPTGRPTDPTGGPTAVETPGAPGGGPGGLGEPSDGGARVPRAAGPGLLAATGTAASVLWWSVGLALVAGGVLVAASAAGHGSATSRRATSRRATSAGAGTSPDRAAGGAR